MGTLPPRSGQILHHIAEISPPDVEISSPRALFRNYSNSIFKLDFIYTNPIDHHQISSISYPYQYLFAPSARKGLGREKFQYFEYVSVGRIEKTASLDINDKPM